MLLHVNHYRQYDDVNVDAGDVDDDASDISKYKVST